MPRRKARARRVPAPQPERVKRMGRELADWRLPQPPEQAEKQRELAAAGGERDTTQPERGHGLWMR